MYIPGNLSAAFGHAESRSCHRLEAAGNVYQGDDQILFGYEILDRVFARKIEVDVGLSAGLHLLHDLLDGTLIDKSVKALGDQLFFEFFRRRNLVLAHDGAQSRSLQSLDVNDHDAFIAVRDHGKHIFVFIFHESDGFLGDFLLHGLVFRAANDFMNLGFGRHELCGSLFVQAHVSLQGQNAVEGVA